MKVFCGIDVGKTGGIAIINNEGKIVFTSTIPKIGKEVHLRQLYDIIGLCNSYINNIAEDEVFVVFENLHSIFGSGAKANFEFGRSNGFIEAFVVSYNYKYIKVNPRDWQKLCWQGIQPKLYYSKNHKGEIVQKVDTKATSSLACTRLYPNTNVKITENGNKSKNDHDGLVDAILLAHYCYIRNK